MCVKNDNVKCKIAAVPNLNGTNAGWKHGYKNTNKYACAHVLINVQNDAHNKSTWCLLFERNIHCIQCRPTRMSQYE